MYTDETYSSDFTIDVKHSIEIPYSSQSTENKINIFKDLEEKEI